MKNVYRTTETEAIIEVKCYASGETHEARISIQDLERVDQFMRGRWYANPARLGATERAALAESTSGLSMDEVLGRKHKCYVFGKVWNGSKWKTVSLHRVVMGEPKWEVHHADNDGLNNTRENLGDVTHQENVRFRWPDTDWKAYDGKLTLEAEYRKERGIAKWVQEEFGLSRQGLWKIRTGKTTGGEAAEAYHARCKDGGIRPFELLKRDNRRDGEQWGVWSR